MEIIDTHWQLYQHPSGFQLKHPPGWGACLHATGAAFVVSPDEKAFVLVQEGPPVPGLTPSQIVQGGAFPAAVVLDQAQAGQVESQPGRASCHVHFKFPDGGSGLALVTCEAWGEGVRVTVCAAREPLGLAYSGPLLWRIARSYYGKQVLNAWEMPHPPALDTIDVFMGKSVPYAAPKPAPPVVAPPPPASLTFVRFTDPQMGTFHVDVPQGWRVGGGFLHAGLGDRRVFVEAQSPNGISVLFGDPNFPQTFYQNPMAWGEDFIPYPQGCVFLNLAADAKKLANYYLKKAAPKRLGQFQVGAARERRDLEDIARRNPALAAFKVSHHEVALRLGGLSGKCLAIAQGNKNSFYGDNWIGNVIVWLAPPALEAIAEQAAMRMANTFAITPQYNQIMMRDESIIAANGNNAVLNQQLWFAGQQAAHRSQMQIGDIITSGYWDQQRAYDGISQRRSDVMLGNERLYDERLGKEYVVPSGSNYYWVDSTSGTVVGTNTETPPDYNRDYRLLKKL